MFRIPDFKLKQNKQAGKFVVTFFPTEFKVAIDVLIILASNTEATERMSLLKKPSLH